MPGVSVLGDRAEGTQPHVHGRGCCPHKIVGPSITASADVFINGVPAMRLGDVGIHAACCGPNMWEVIEASAGLFVNGSGAVRKGDKTLHCGISLGHMIQASGNVVDNSLADGPFGQGLRSFLPVTGPNVVAIPDGAQVIRDDLGNPIGWASCGKYDEVGHIYDTRGNDVGYFLVPQHADAHPDDSLLNPINLITAPIGGVEKEGAKAAFAGLKDLLSSAAKRGVKSVADAIPRSREDLYARLYNKAVDITHKPPADGRPGPVPFSPAPEGYADAAKQVGLKIATTLAQHAFQAWKRSHGLL